MNLHMDALAIQTWGQKVDAVVILIPFTVELTAVIVLTLLVATVMLVAILQMTVAMTFLKLDALVRYTACINVHTSIHILFCGNC